MGKKKQSYDRHLPPIGTNLTGKFFSQRYSAKVVTTPQLKEGRGIEYAGKIFSSMSAAAKVITKQSVNGWRFWRLQ